MDQNQLPLEMLLEGALRLRQVLLNPFRGLRVTTDFSMTMG